MLPPNSRILACGPGVMRLASGLDPVFGLDARLEEVGDFQSPLIDALKPGAGRGWGLLGFWSELVWGLFGFGWLGA